jgi:uncharacterized protein (UPF0218 family)
MTLTDTIATSEPRNTTQIVGDLLSDYAFFFSITFFVKNVDHRSEREKIINVPMNLLLAA